MNGLTSIPKLDRYLAQSGEIEKGLRIARDASLAGGAPVNVGLLRKKKGPLQFFRKKKAVHSPEFVMIPGQKTHSKIFSEDLERLVIEMGESLLRPGKTVETWMANQVTKKRIPLAVYDKFLRPETSTKQVMRTNRLRIKPLLPK
jgi:hypothetical protein